MLGRRRPYVIVVALDYSESGDLALERALELAAENPASAVHVVNVLPVFASGETSDQDATPLSGKLPSIPKASERLREHVQRRATLFRDAQGGRQLPFLDNIVAHQRVDSPAEEIAQLAVDLEADLVVVGTHNRRGISRIILGSVSEGTVRLAPCPVLVVRAKAVPAPVPAILPPCAQCLEERQISGGKELWCAQHRERHGQRHVYQQGDRGSVATNMGLLLHPQARV